jgi:hypothetical protein
MTVIGGVGSLPGALLGAAFVTGIPLIPGLRDIEIIDFLTSGVGVVLILYFMPGGLAEGFYRIRDNFLRRVAVKHQIHVPSLIADSLVEEQEKEAADHVLEAAELHLEEEPTGAVSAAAGGVELIGCPACGARIPVEEAQYHSHFRVAQGEAEAPEPEYVPASRRGSR